MITPHPHLNISSNHTIENERKPLEFLNEMHEYPRLDPLGTPAHRRYPPWMLCYTRFAAHCIASSYRCAQIRPEVLPAKGIRPVYPARAVEGECDLCCHQQGIYSVSLQLHLHRLTCACLRDVVNQLGSLNKGRKRCGTFRRVDAKRFSGCSLHQVVTPKQPFLLIRVKFPCLFLTI